MEEPQPVLPYEAPPDQSRGLVTPICGLIAFVFSLAVLIATAVEDMGARQWHGLEVAGLWICLLSTPVMAAIAIFTGIRRLLKLRERQGSTWIGLSGGVVSILVLVLWFVRIIMH